MPETDGESLWQTEARLLASMAARLADPKFPTGDHAALRRMDPRAPDGMAEIAVERLLASAAVASSGEDRRRWALIVHCLALVRGRHEREAPIGRVLADSLYSESRSLYSESRSLYSESRLNLLLSADFDVLTDLLPRLARFLDAHNAAADWLPLVRIARWAGRREDIADDERLRIARYYARASATKENT